MTAYASEPVRVRNGRRIHELCSLVTRETMKRDQAALSEVGLTRGGYNLLKVLRENDSLTIADIRRKLRVESATISTLVLRMERDGLVQKAPSPKDKRAFLLTPTEHAKTLLERADQFMAVEASDMTHRLNDGEQVQLIMLLERILENLSPSDAPPKQTGISQ